MLFRTLANAVHSLNHSRRMLPHRGFRRQHDGIRSIQYGVSDIKHFCSCWLQAGHHRLHHLSGRDNHFVGPQGGGNQSFLYPRQLCITNLNAQVPSGHHNDIRCINNGVDILQRLYALNLSHNVRLTPCFT